MEWIEPSLTDAIARERSIARKYTRMTKVPDADWPDSHQAWLVVGAQQFRVGVAMETRDEAEWVCRMLANALIAVIDHWCGRRCCQTPGRCHERHTASA